MPKIQSNIITNSESFRGNREAMLDLIKNFRSLEEKIRARASHTSRKKNNTGTLSARQRLDKLLDVGSPWLEVASLAGLGLYEDDGKDTVLGAGAITGIGLISGVSVAILVMDPSFKGGTSTPATTRKILRHQQIALENKLPYIILQQSGGANLKYQAEMLIEGGGVFYNQARFSSLGLPMITVVHGNSTAGGAYIPGMSDYVIMVRESGKIFLAGPPLLKAATGEIADEQSLGGAIMHTSVSGVSEYSAANDAEGIDIARDIVSKLGRERFFTNQRSYCEPDYPPEELCGVMPVDFKRPIDVREIIARIVDGSEFTDFKPRYGASTICGFSSIFGYECGVVSNNAPIDADGAAKAAQFMQLCDQSKLPIIFLVNTTGFLVGTKQEQAGVVKHGAKMIQAIANVRVPKFSINIGANFGAGNYAMCGRAFRPRFLFSWPNSRLAVMGGRQIAGIFRTITEKRHEAKGTEPDYAALDAQETEIIEQIERESSALFCTARGYDDGLIDPRYTRSILGFSLLMSHQADSVQLNSNTFGVGRM